MSVERYEEEQADQIAAHAPASVEVLPQDQAEKAREESREQKEGCDFRYCFCSWGDLPPADR